MKNFVLALLLVVPMCMMAQKTRTYKNVTIAVDGQVSTYPQKSKVLSYNGDEKIDIVIMDVKYFELTKNESKYSITNTDGCSENYYSNKTDGKLYLVTTHKKKRKGIKVSENKDTYMELN